MNGAEGGREIAIDTDGEGQARSGGKIACCAADSVERYEQSHGREDPCEAEARGEEFDAVNETVWAGDGLRRKHEEKGCGASNVTDGEDDAGDEDSPGNGAARVLDFIAHGGGALDGRESEEDAGPEDGVVERPVRDEAGGRDVEDESEAEIAEDGEEDEYGEREQAAECADVVEPLSGVDAEDVEDSDDGEPEDGEGHVVKRIGRERLGAGAEGEERGGCAEVEDAGEKGKIAHPVRPGANETGEIAEGLAGPDVDAAFLRIARGEFHDAGGERDEETGEGSDPNDEDAGAGGGGGGRPADAEDDDDVEQHQVAKPDAALECGNGRHVARSIAEARAWMKLNCLAVLEDGHGGVTAVDADDAAAGVSACAAEIEALHGRAGG